MMVQTLPIQLTAFVSKHTLTFMLKAQTERKRLSAEERREMVLEAAIIEFGKHGLHGASTIAIAKEVGVSEPYLYRLFKTKKELFIASAERAFAKVNQSLVEAATAHPEDKFGAMARAFDDFLEQRHELLFSIQIIASSADSEVQQTAQRLIREHYFLLVKLTGADPLSIQHFMARGWQLVLFTAIDLPALAEKEAWVKDLL